MLSKIREIEQRRAERRAQQARDWDAKQRQAREDEKTNCDADFQRMIGKFRSDARGKLRYADCDWGTSSQERIRVCVRKRPLTALERNARVRRVWARARVQPPPT